MYIYTERKERETLVPAGRRQGAPRLSACSAQLSAVPGTHAPARKAAAPLPAPLPLVPLRPCVYPGLTLFPHTLPPPTMVSSPGVCVWGWEEKGP